MFSSNFLRGSQTMLLCCWLGAVVTSHPAQAQVLGKELGSTESVVLVSGEFRRVTPLTQVRWGIQTSFAPATLEDEVLMFAYPKSILDTLGQEVVPTLSVSPGVVVLPPSADENATSYCGFTWKDWSEQRHNKERNLIQGARSLIEQNKNYVRICRASDEKLADEDSWYIAVPASTALATGLATRFKETPILLWTRKDAWKNVVGRNVTQAE